MRKSVMIAGNPWTLFITLEEDPDSLGAIARFQELNMDGEIVDSWEVRYDRLEAALRELEMAYGISEADWV